MEKHKHGAGMAPDGDRSVCANRALPALIKTNGLTILVRCDLCIQSFSFEYQCFS